MAIFDVEIIFCCPCFVSNIIPAMFLDYKVNYEFASFVNRRNPKKTFDIDNFEKKNSMLITCFEHLSQPIYLDNCVCLHYYKSTFYRTIIKNEPYPMRKCYLCSRQSVKKFLKYFPRFII